MKPILILFLMVMSFESFADKSVAPLAAPSAGEKASTEYCDPQGRFTQSVFNRMAADHVPFQYNETRYLSQVEAIQRELDPGIKVIDEITIKKGETSTARVHTHKVEGWLTPNPVQWVAFYRNAAKSPASGDLKIDGSSSLEIDYNQVKSELNDRRLNYYEFPIKNSNLEKIKIESTKLESKHPLYFDVFRYVLSDENYVKYCPKIKVDYAKQSPSESDRKVSKGSEDENGIAAVVNPEKEKPETARGAGVTQ